MSAFSFSIKFYAKEMLNDMSHKILVLAPNNNDFFDNVAKLFLHNIAHEYFVTIYEQWLLE